MSDLIHIPFHGGEVLAVMESNKPRIILKPAVEHIGLDYSWQLKKLKAKSWATVGETPTVGADGKVREMASVDVRTFLMMLATIDEKRVAPEAKDILVAYQSEVADVIEAYFTTGQAINPRGQKALSLSMTVTFEEAVALYYQESGYEPPHGLFTQALRLAGYLKQGGCVPRKKRWKYFFFNGTSWEIRTWALSLLFGEFEDVLRQFHAHPWDQPRLDDGFGQRVLPMKRGES